MNDNLKMSNYYLADGARMNLKINKFYDYGVYRYSIFANTFYALIADVGPFLINVDGNNLCKDWILKDGYGLSWGVFLKTDANLDQLLVHLESIITVVEEGGKELFFRYYDPRVLRIFLPTCSPDQLLEFFGPVKYFLCEDENPDNYLKYSLNDRELIIEKFSVNDIKISDDLTENSINNKIQDKYKLDNDLDIDIIV